MCRYWNSVWHRYGFVLNVSAIKFNWKITFQWVFKWCVVSVNHNAKWVFEPFQLIDRLTRPLFLTVQVWNAFVDLITIQSNPKNQIKTRQTHCIDLTISIGHLMNTHNILSRSVVPNLIDRLMTKTALNFGHQIQNVLFTNWTNLMIWTFKIRKLTFCSFKSIDSRRRQNVNRLFEASHIRFYYPRKSQNTQWES